MRIRSLVREREGGDQRTDRRPHKGVGGVPRGIDPTDLVSDELRAELGYASLGGRHNGLMRKNWSFQVYAEIVRDEADWAHVYAMLMHDLPRWFHQLPPAAQVEALQVRPELTGTHWDALLAALVEHVARLHDHPAPA